jgi:hypothetical protein
MPDYYEYERILPTRPRRFHTRYLLLIALILYAVGMTIAYILSTKGF